MKKPIPFIIILLTLLVNISFSQDIIVTNKKDTIICKLISVDEHFVTFKLKANGQKSIKRSLNKDEIFSIDYGSFSPEKNIEKKDNFRTKTVYSQKGDRGRFGLNCGLSYITADIEEPGENGIDEHFCKLRRGFNTGISATYFLKDNIGLGVKFCNYRSTNKKEISRIITETTIEKYILDEEIGINYIGPAFLIKKDTYSENNKVILGLSLGYLNFRDVTKADRQSKIVTGETIGFNPSMGSDFMIAESLGLGFEIEGIFGILSEFNIDGSNYKPSEKMGCSRVNINIGLRIY